MASLSRLDLLNLHAPFELMRFTLDYDGDLLSTGNKPRPADVWQIRKNLHPQIHNLCQTHRVLRMIFVHPPQPQVAAHAFRPIRVGPSWFMPLVRESASLVCGVKVLFLRKEEPGSLILQGGDIDGRIKTLFDALSVPNEQQLRGESTIDNPMFCLMENDALITNFAVRTDRLVSSLSESVHEVRLVIEVDVRVQCVNSANMIFVGD